MSSSLTEPAPRCPRCGDTLAARHGVCPACTARTLLAPDMAYDDEPAGGLASIAHYDVIEEIGRGAMGVVFRARDRRLGRIVALKVILTGRLASVAERRRFIVEVEAAARLDHPAIVTMHESGEENGLPWCAMQFIEGETLADRLACGRLEPRAAAAMAAAVARAVQHAHERGVLHRDLKPGNVILDASGAPHVADFGLARQVDRDSTLTLAGSPLGTPAYMAPEASAGGATAAADIWSLGVMLYEMLAGAPPFAAADFTGVLVAARQADPAPLTNATGRVDRDLEAICLRCMEKDPAARWPSAAAFADDLDRWLRGEPVTARPASARERILKWARRRPAVAALSAAAVLLLLSGTAGVLWQWRRADAAAAAATAALQRAEESLWQANLNEARALRISRAAGQRRLSLAALARAASHRFAPELRDEAIAALALPDLGEPELLPHVPAAAASLTANPDLTHVAHRAGADLVLRRLSDEKPLGVLSGSDPRHHWVSPDFTRLLALFGPESPRRTRGLALWDVPGKRRIAAWDDCAYGVDFLPDASRLLVCGAGKLRLHESADGREVVAVPCPLIPATVAVTPDGTAAALGESRRVEVWSLSPPARRAVLPALAEDVTSLAWMADVLLVGSGQDVFAWRSGPGDLRPVTRHDREGTIVTPHPDGQFVVTTAWDGMLRFCHPALADPLLQIAGLRPVRLSGDGTRLLVNSADRAGICAVMPPDVWRCTPLRPDESSGVLSLFFTADSRLLVGLSSTSLAAWDPESLRLRPPLPFAGATCAQEAPDGRILVLGNGSGLTPVRIAEDSFAADAPLPGDWRGFTAFALSPDGRRAFCLGPRRAAVMELASGAELVRMALPSGVANPAWSPDGRWLAVGHWDNGVSAGHHCLVLSPEDGKELAKLPSGNCIPVFTPDAARLFVSSTNTCVEHACGTWTEVRRHRREAAGLDHGSPAFCAAGGLAALLENESVIRLLRLDGGEQIARLTPPFPHKISPAGLRFSPDGRWLACEARQSVRIWNLALLRTKLAELGLDWE